MSTPANWYPDPSGRHEHRYWDGTDWTDHVSDAGVTGVDPLGPPPPPTSTAAARTAAVTTTPAAAGTGSLLTEPVLVVNQKVKVIELTNQYLVFDQHGNRVGAVNQVGQSTMKKVARFVSSLDQFMTHHLEITDNSGAVVLRLTRPRKLVKSSVLMSDGAGRELGRIVQVNMVGKIRFDLEDADGRRVGGIFGENWRAWNFRIENAEGREVARITKTWEGLAKTLFTTADNYVVQIHERQPEPLNSLIVAAALGVDTALKQDARGLS